jgi:threonylcarbamoyladenosine tRNA methylthiotransferase MtaB
MKYCVLTFGCRANQADSCQIEVGFRDGGAEPAPPESADVVVVNSCTVTASADQAARHAIRRVARRNPGARIVATGCYATRCPSEMSALPGTVALVPNVEKFEIAARFTPTRSGASTDRLPGPGSRGRTAHPLRVQTGCDESCAYCIVPGTRGPGRSRPVTEVLTEVRAAAAAGYKELWLTGVHLGSYGRDLEPRRSFTDLLRALDQAAAGHDLTFRLSSLEPMDCSDEVIDCLAASPRFLPHVHLPLQHASDRMLRSMRRPYTFAGFQRAVDRLRSCLPDAAIGTDLIAGFPGEGDDDFERQAEYLRTSPVSHAHIFTYSDRPGTDAARMPGKLPAPEIRRRAAALREIAAGLTQAFVTRQVGSERPALTLANGTLALTDNYIKLRIPRGRSRNERVRVRIDAAEPPTGKVVA